LWEPEFKMKAQMIDSIFKQKSVHVLVFLKRALLLSDFLYREHGGAFQADHLPQRLLQSHYCIHHHLQHHLWQECF